MTPLVSIIIPVYNSEKYLREAILSALNQTYKSIELILVDDGSADNSLAIAKTFESEHVKVFHQENKGAGAARNKGLQESSGEYIQYLDADDLLNTNKIESQIRLLKAYPQHLSACATVHFQDGTDPSALLATHDWYAEGTNNPADFLIKLYGGGHIGPDYGGMVTVHSWLSPKSVLDKAGPWNEELSLDDDGEYFCRALLASAGVIYSHDGIAYYRKFAAGYSLSSQKSYKGFASSLKSNQLKTEYLLSHTDDARAKIAMSRVFWDNAFSFYPFYKDLSSEAEKKAISLDPVYQYKPYEKGVKRILSNLFGWKTTRYFQSLRNNKLPG